MRQREQLAVRDGNRFPTTGDIENDLDCKLDGCPVPGCEWEPAACRPARPEDAHTRSTPPRVILGTEANWRLCAACAALPRFTHFTVRTPITAKVRPLT